MVISVPKKITDPMGAQRGLFERIIGTTPMDAAADVRNIGRIRRFPERKAASRAVKPCFNRNC